MIAFRIGTFLACGLVLAASTVAMRGQVPAILADFTKPDSGVEVTQWHLVGPFHFDPKELDSTNADKLPVGLNRDYLAQIGATAESSVDGAAFSLLKTAPDCEIATGPFFASPDTNIVDLAAGSKRCDYAVAYLAVEIESPVDQEIVIATGADDNVKMWLNHELILADPVNIHRFIKKFAHLTGAKLRKGKNFLLVKTGNITHDWRLIVTLFPHSRALQLAEDNGVNPILVHSVISASRQLELRGDLLPSMKHTEAIITDARYKVVDSWQPEGSTISMHSLERLEKDHIYFCRVVSNGRTVKRPFFYGDVNAGFARLTQLTEQSRSGDERVEIALEGQIARVRHLIKPESQSSEDWDQKLAAGFAEMEANLSVLAQGATAFQHAPGTHIRGYRSSVDGQVINYWIHVPEGAQRSGNPMPLVVVLPGTWLEHQPFVESPQVALWENTERYRVLGDEFQFAVLQVWGRGNYLGGTAIWNREVFEAMEAVKRDYSIDENRIYLVGACEGGRQALLLAERYPRRFAAVAAYGPISIYESRAWRFAPWIRYSSPIVSVANLAGTPVFINHDVNDQPPARESELFVNKARAAGVDATLVQTAKGFHGFSQDPTGDQRSLFQFLQDKHRAPQAHADTNVSKQQGFGAGQGPIEDAFGAPVLVVEGTGGTSEQHASVHALAQGVLAEWKRAYFADCPSKYDSDVTANDLEKYNLVLIGDSKTNTLLERFASSLPAAIEPARFAIAGNTYDGSQLGYEFLAINPLHPARYFVVIGMTQWGSLRGWRVHPSREGIADFMVFDLQGPVARLRDAGYYETSYWGKAESTVSTAAH